MKCIRGARCGGRAIWLLLVLVCMVASACRPSVLEATPAPSDTPAPARTATQRPPTGLPPTATRESLQPLTEVALMNAEYAGIYDEPVSLTDGRYMGEPFEEYGASRPIVDFTGAYAWGDLDGDGVDDAAVVLAENSGSSGTFIYLAAVLNRRGHPENVATTLLGDRVQVQAVEIVDGEISVSSVSHGPNDPMCCPSQRVGQLFVLKAGELVMVSSYTLTDVEPAAGPDGRGVLWQWWGFVGDDPAAPSIIPDPEDYTLLLAHDGTVLIEADCNVVGGAYTLQGDMLTIELGPATIAECGGASLAQQYTRLLASVERVSLDSDRLVLHLAENAGRMIFAAPAITAVTWQWSRLVQTEPASEMVVPEPQKYTLRLAPDGSLSIKADCNSAGGSYELEGASLTIELGPTTLAECGEGSLDQEYMQLLADVESFSVDEDQLALHLAADAGAMVFTAPVVTFVTWEWRELVETEPAALTVVPDPQSYTLMLAPDGAVRIKADCNGVGGSYELAGDALTIELGPTTLAECAEGSLDQQYLSLLERVNSFSLQGSQLVLYLADDSGRMVFGTPIVSLVTWEWTELVELDPPAKSVVPDPARYTLLLRPDGTLVIKADCNDVGGTYSLAGDALTIQLGATTLAECPEGSLDAQYLALLRDVGGYRLKGARLVLELADGVREMVFREATQAPEP